ncbi:MAG: murein transglycosylase A [Proteobacteria bacterium]|nr:murein transglycosylase A [Pseudomonadota bacterium]
MFLKRYNSKKFLIWLVCVAILVVTILFLYIKNKEGVILRDASFSDLKAWDSQNFTKLKSLALKNCEQLDLFYRSRAFNENFGTLDQWQNFCSGLNSLQDDKITIKQYFEKLSVVSVETPFRDNSLFTGYYSPILNGSYTKTDKFKYPLYKKPADLVSGNLEEFFPNNKDFKFKKIFAKLDTEKGVISPYYNREQIEQDGILSEDDVIVWVDDKIDAFFLQIQGSGTVKLENGEKIFVGYSAQNGKNYYAIGAYLVEKDWLTKEEVSLQTIKSFLQAHPEVQDEVLHQNESYVFFKKKEDGPYGAFGMILESNHSIAVDRNYIPLGVPLFIETKLTADDSGFNNMVFAQDIGGAINGEIRADIFFGEGLQAELYSGKQKSQGKMYVFSAKSF